MTKLVSIFLMSEKYVSLTPSCNCYNTLYPAKIELVARPAEASSWSVAVADGGGGPPAKPRLL